MDHTRHRLPAATWLLTIGLLAGCGQSGNEQPADTAAPVASTERAAPEPATEGAAGAPSRAVDSETLAYADVNEKLVYGYFAFPSDMVEPLPAVVLVHDWWGLDEDTRASANRLAAEGYMVLAVDLYAGETVDVASDARQMTIDVLGNPGDVQENIRQAIEFVSVAGSPTTGTVGWGFGGGWALQSAMLFPDQINAVVLFYGQVSSDEARLGRLDAPVLALFGGDDQSISEASIDAFERSMLSLAKPIEIEVFQGAGSAFADPKRSKFDPVVTEQAWERMLEFLAVSLPGTADT